MAASLLEVFTAIPVFFDFFSKIVAVDSRKSPSFPKTQKSYSFEYQMFLLVAVICKLVNNLPFLVILHLLINIGFIFALTFQANQSQCDISPSALLVKKCGFRSYRVWAQTIIFSLKHYFFSARERSSAAK